MKAGMQRDTEIMRLTGMFDCVILNAVLIGWSL